MTQYAELEEKLGVVDYAVYQEYLDGGKQDKELFAKYRDNVMDALMRTGATLFKNAPIIEYKARLKKVSKKFFNFSQEVKESYTFPNSFDNRGYVQYGKKKPQDFKEFFHVDRGTYEALKGVPFEEIHNLISADDMEKQLELCELIDDFREASIEFTGKANEMGDSVLEVCADYFELDDAYLAEMKCGNSVLRLLHYPAFNPELLAGVLNPKRAVGHVDASFETLLIPSDEWGLWVAHKNDVADTLGTTFTSKDDLDKIPEEKRIFIPPGAPYVFMNAGRPFEIFTNGLVTGTVHGVDNVPGHEHEERYSEPFFKHVGWGLTLKPWDKAIEIRDGINYFEEKGPQPITVEEYVLDSDTTTDPVTNIKTPVPLHLQKRSWIDPSPDKPLPVYKPT